MLEERLQTRSSPTAATTPTGATPPTPPASPSERLSQHSTLLAGWLANGSTVPPRWRSELFARGVDLVRSHLRPIENQSLLAHSYGREQFHVMAVGLPPAPRVLLSRHATEVAYALRWLEIESGRLFGPWLEAIAEGPSTRS